MERNADRTPKPGEIYRHFKNKLYQIVGVAKHSETGELMVVYQALYGSFGLYVRPLEMFISPVDREKYPQAAQKFRFERVRLPEAEPEKPKEPEGDEREDAREEDFRESPNPDLIRFLEAEGMDEKLEALAKLEKTATQADLNGLAAALETDLGRGEIAEQIENVRRMLAVQARYDGSRLRER